MSGKPKPKPKPEAKPAHPKSEKSAPQPEQKSPNRPQRRQVAPSEKPESSDDDNPFEVDTSIARKAIAVAPRPTKSRTLRVTCPMCETPGFINPADAGKNVKCCNETCMVPIFKAPVPEKEEEPEEEKSGGGILLYGGGAVAVIAAGVAVWWFVLREPEVVDPGPVTPTVVQNNDGEEKDILGDFGQAINLSNDRKKPETPVELRDTTLELMAELTSKRLPEHLRLTATSYAVAEKNTEARNFLDMLKKVSSGRNGYQQVEPLVQLAWNQIKSPQQAEPDAMAAISAMDTVPSAIREPLDAASSLAALLVALNKNQEAETLIKRIQTKDPRGRLSSIWSSAVNTGTFDFALETDRPYHLMLPEPLRVSVIHELVAHGHADQALALVDGASDVAGKESAFAAWAGRLGDVDNGAMARVEQTIASKQIGKSGQIQAWAALASHFHSRGDAANAQTALGKATALLDALEAPAPVEMLSMKAIHGSKGKPHAGLGDPAPALATTLAATAVGLLQVDMGQTEAGWTNIQKAVDSARGMSPSPAKAAQVAEDAVKKPASVKAQLNAILNFGSNEQKASLEMGRYRTQADALNAIAQNRLDIQVAILREAARRGLANQAWEYAKSMSEAPLDERDPYYSTSLPGWLKNLAQVNGNQSLLQKINAEYQGQVLQKPREIDRLYAAALNQVNKNQLEQARESLKALYVWAGGQQQQLTAAESFEIDTIAFRLACLVQEKQSDIAEAFEFSAMQKDAAMKADALLLISAKAVTTGKAYLLWDVATNVREDARGITLNEHDKLSMGRGFIAGLNAPASATPQEVSVSAAEK